MKKSEKSMAGWYFLGIVLLLYLIAGIVNHEILIPSLLSSYLIFKKVILAFLFVFAVMVVTNYFVKPELIKKHIGESSGMKRWAYAVIGGIISTGPIYFWYPLLKQLKLHGVSYGFIAAFLYNRAVKIPFIPLMVVYFGIAFVIVLSITMIIVSILQGFIFEKLEGGNLI